MPLSERWGVTQADEVVLGAGDGDVEEVRAFVEEGEGAFVGDDAGKKDDAAFAALEAVDGAEGEPAGAREGSGVGFDELGADFEGDTTVEEAAAKLLELAAVGGDDGDVFGGDAAVQEVFDEEEGFGEFEFVEPTGAEACLFAAQVDEGDGVAEVRGVT